MTRAPRLFGLAAILALAASPPAFARLIHLHAVLTPMTAGAPAPPRQPGTRQVALTLPAAGNAPSGNTGAGNTGAGNTGAGNAPGGMFVATFNTLSHRLRYRVTCHDLAGRVLGATIDGPLDRSRILVHLRIRDDGRIEGSARLGGRTEALVRRGETEVVIATTADRGGEIGGRIRTGRPPRH